MMTASCLVLLGGSAAIAWVNWFFFIAPRRRATAAGPTISGIQEVAIVVRGGYEPSTIRVRPGVPVRLVFDRQETSGCSEEVVLPDFGVRRFLPPGERTAIEVTPPRPGTYEFTCGMGMVRGTIVAERNG